MIAEVWTVLYVVGLIYQSSKNLLLATMTRIIITLACGGSSSSSTGDLHIDPQELSSPIEDPFCSSNKTSHLWLIHNLFCCWNLTMFLILHKHLPPHKRLVAIHITTRSYTTFNIATRISWNDGQIAYTLKDKSRTQNHNATN